MSTSILIADDHAVVREGIRGLLRLDPGFVIVGEADDGASALALSARLQPMVLLLDLLMPNTDAPAVIHDVREASPQTHIMVLSSTDDALLMQAATRAGAHSFLSKSQQGEHLLAAVRAAAQGRATWDGAVMRRVLEAGAQPVDPFADLTTREREVLQCLAEGSSNARIADVLGISEKTVKAHLGSVMSKLDAPDRTRLVALAWQKGLMR